MDVPRSRVALVTGASRGIGRHIALALADHGLAVGLVARTASTLDQVAAVAREHGARVTSVAVDVTDQAEVAYAVQHVEQTLGPVDLLINNAGVIEEREVPFADDDLADMWQVIETNVKGPLALAHALVPLMRARGGGRIVNLNSGAGYRPMPAYTGYAISKGALARLTSLLDAQYRAAGIRAFDLAPGHVATDMTGGMPMHAGRTQWTAPQRVTDLVLAVADGRLDALSGRLFRADVDTPDSLLSHVDDITSTDARALRLRAFGADDPIK